MSLFVERKEQTEFGEIEISITRGSHMCVRGEPEIRGTKFTCNLHFWLQPDGTWAVRDQDNPKMERKWAAGMTVRDALKAAPPTYFKKVLDAYTAVVNAFAIASPRLFAEAETSDIDRDIAGAEAKVAEAQQKLTEAKAALDTLYLKRRKHHLTTQKP
jgi:hypothetical protein